MIFINSLNHCNIFEGKNADSKGTLGGAGKGECCSYKTDGEFILNPKSPI